MTVEQASVTQAIRANDDELERNIRAKDAAALVRAFYAQDAVLMPPDNPVISGQAAITEFWQGMVNAGMTDATLTIVRVEASGDLAMEIGSYKLTVGGNAANGKYLVTHRRQADGSWKAIADMFSGVGS